MNCLAFRSAVLADPRRVDSAAVLHAAQCEACRTFLGEALEFEARLGQALRVPVPAQIESWTPRARASLPRPRRWLALAAGLALAAAVGITVSLPRPDPVALAGIHFVIFEEAQTLLEPPATDWGELVRTATRMGVAIPEELGKARFVCVYPFAAGSAHHLVVRTPFGKVTLLLLPERRLPSRATASASGLEAVALPAGGGSLVIVGDSARSVARAEMLLKPEA
jgi:hypothetical protein